MENTLSNLCIHTITTKPWSIEECAQYFSKAGIGGISVWRNTLEGRNIKSIGNLLRDQNLKIVSLVRGGFFASPDFNKRQAGIDDNLKAIDEASALGAPLIVLVCGADPNQSLEKSQDQIKEGIYKVLPYAKENNVKLAIEPLHPVYAAERSAINTLKSAIDMALDLNHDYIGVALDVYHVWWDPELQNETRRCGKEGKLFAYHICDWKANTLDVLNDRGIMGEGCIPVKQIGQWVAETGFAGMQEVEIFSNLHWATDQHQYLKTIINSYIKTYQ